MTPTGQVLLYDNAPTPVVLLATINLDGSGGGSAQSILPVGDHALQARYSGDAIHPAANSLTMDFVVVSSQKNVTVTLAANPQSPVLQDTQVTFTVSVVEVP